MNAISIHALPKLNPQNVKELLQNTNPNESPISKKRIYDDPGEFIRTLNKKKRLETNKRFNDDYFNQFHPSKS